MDDHSLARKLFRIVAIKLVALFVLWWIFVRPLTGSADPAAMAPEPRQTTQGETSHGQ